MPNVFPRNSGPVNDLPSPRGDAAMRIDETPRDRQQQREDVVGDGMLVRPGRDGDEDVAVTRRFEVDALVPDAPA